MKIEKWKKGRNFALYDDYGELVAVMTYKKGAENVKRLLEYLTSSLEEATEEPSLYGDHVRTVEPVKTPNRDTGMTKKPHVVGQPATGYADPGPAIWVFILIKEVL